MLQHDSNSASAEVGLGFRREHITELNPQTEYPINYFEVAPENWLHVSPSLRREFRAFTEAYAFRAHGLSLSLGGINSLDTTFLKQVKAFLDLHNIEHFSEHLSACSDQGHLYDLMPVPFTEEGVKWISQRIRQTSDILNRPIAIENVSYYSPSLIDMTELEFLKAILAESDCRLLLDVNNLYVNSINHGYDPYRFIETLPTDRIEYIHVAGHYVEQPDLLIDTHGAPVADPVWALLKQTYRQHGAHSTLLERDFNIPPMVDLLKETEIIRTLQREVSHDYAAA